MITVAHIVQPHERTLIAAFSSGQQRRDDHYDGRSSSRRKFLQYVASSPLLRYAEIRWDVPIVGFVK
jgi:hypothetical protein